MNTYDGLTLPAGFDRDSIIKSINWLADRTAKEGKERALIMNSEGRIIWSTLGNDEMVEAGPESLKGRCQSLIMLHSHPTPAELSNMDLSASRAMDAAATFAVSRDGSVSWTHGLKRGVTPFHWMMWEWMMREDLWSKRQEDMRALQTGEFTLSQAARMNHQGIEYFRKQVGALQDYHAFYGPELKELLKKEGIVV